MNRGILLVLSAPSGAGKSTLCQALADAIPGLFVSVSCTTRPPRRGETDGRDYVFLSEEEFRGRESRGDFLESARVHGNAYGSPRRPVEERLAAGADVVMDIDTQGAAAVKKSLPESVLVFISPPSMKALEDRLRGRNQDDEATIQRRLTAARAEMAQAPRYDYLVLNDDLSAAVEDLRAILRAEKRRVSRRKDEWARLDLLQPSETLDSSMRRNV